MPSVPRSDSLCAALRPVLSQEGRWKSADSMADVAAALGAAAPLIPDADMRTRFEELAESYATTARFQAEGRSMRDLDDSAFDKHQLAVVTYINQKCGSSESGRFEPVPESESPFK
jgi:hypothetical protein